jgi:hypothetical protein
MRLTSVRDNEQTAESGYVRIGSVSPIGGRLRMAAYIAKALQNGVLRWAPDPHRHCL